MVSFDMELPKQEVRNEEALNLSMFTAAPAHPVINVKLPNHEFFLKAIDLRSQGFKSLMAMLPTENQAELEPALLFKFGVATPTLMNGTGPFVGDKKSLSLGQSASCF